MTNELSAAVLARLDRLERENRRHRRAALLCALGCFTWLACSVGQDAHTLAAQRFALVAPDGTEKAVLELDDKGNAMLSMRNESASALLTTNGPSLLLRGPDGKTGAFVGIDSRNSARMELTSHRLLDGVRLSVHEDGSSGVYVLDADGKQRAGLESLSTGGAGIHLRDARGNVRGSFGMDPDDVPNLLLLDEDGVRRLGMLVQKDGNPSLELDDGKGRPRVEVSTLFDGSPAIEAYREDGSPAFRAP